MSSWWSWRPYTPRGALSTIGAFYDLFRFLGQVMLREKQVLQAFCSRRHEWEMQMLSDLQNQWKEWLRDIRELEHFEVPRCFKPENSGNIQQAKHRLSTSRHLIFCTLPFRNTSNRIDNPGLQRCGRSRGMPSISKHRCQSRWLWSVLLSQACQ